ncbi:MAG: LysR family transcriptional regulator, glycine cleavage system transcriptional activator [Pseudomonadota bacterium]|nr:LysR family transcriptional regulator, glycine cleavage system transcriptional activator [Pseudomonadota bacterium]
MNKPIDTRINERNRRLPSLDPLKGFESAARHLSFTLAAAELHLTQSAISRQIQTLEDQLGVRLFHREVRRLRLTNEGEALQRVVGEMLARLAEVCSGFRAAQRRPQVNLTAAVGIASLWLVPRLASFQQTQPDVDVRISADNRVVDLEREGFDVALRYLAADEASPGATLLFEEEVFPVAAPQLAARLPKRLSAEDFSQVVLLAYDDDRAAPWFSWEPWLLGLGLAGAKPKAVLRFNQYDQIMRAAEDGQGVALGRGPLVVRALAEGRLKALAVKREKMPARGYYLVRAAASGRPEVDCFFKWLQQEAEQTVRQMQATQ